MLVTPSAVFLALLLPSSATALLHGSSSVHGFAPPSPPRCGPGVPPRRSAAAPASRRTYGGGVAGGGGVGGGGGGFAYYCFDSTRLRGSISKWNEGAEDDFDDDFDFDDDDRQQHPRDKQDQASSVGDERSSSSPSTHQKAQRKKRGGKEYRASSPRDDDRDSLPFVVAERTPDPYTPPLEMAREARKNSDSEAIEIRRRRRGGGGASASSSGISASLVRSVRSDGSLHRVLGEFVLDSSTNCGDLLLISDREYEVVSARSQFRYAGGRRFVLVRKVLEVKEVGRIAKEASLGRLMEREDGISATGKNFE